MKRLLIGLLAVAGLLASVLALATSVTSPASAQTGSSVQLVNVHSVTGDEKATDSAEQVIVTVTPVSNCNPGNRGAIGSPYTLNAGDGTEITGLLSTNCNWEIQFAHATGACPVSATTVNDGADGDTENDGSLILAGVGGNNKLQHGNNKVDTINFDILPGGCASTYAAEATITIPTTAVNDVSVYRGLEFDITFTSSREGCNSPVSTTITVPETVPTGGAITSEEVVLTHQSQADIAGGSSTISSRNRCSYNVNFPAEVGALALQRGSSTSINGGTDAVGGPTNADGDVVPAEVTATYAPVTIPVSVVAVYPDDEVFTTADKASYVVDVVSPCGGYVGSINPNFGRQGDTNTVQIFPGPVTVYGEVLNQIRTAVGNFSVQAYADTAGTMPCTVRVTERQSPERCTAAGGTVQTQTYVAGTDSFSFVFNYTCTAGETSEDVVGTPPTPGGGETDGPPPDTATDGPVEEVGAG